MDLMLPGMPNLRDEEGQPLSYPQGEGLPLGSPHREGLPLGNPQAPHGEGLPLSYPQGWEKAYQYRGHVEDFSVKPGFEPDFEKMDRRHLQRNDLPGQGKTFQQIEPQPNQFHGQDQDRRGQRNGLSGQGDDFQQVEQRHLQGNDFPVSGQGIVHGTDPSNGEATPPLPPPRNYSSQYRSDFHARHSPQHQSPARSRQNHPASSRHSMSDHASNASNSRTNLSQEMDGSLLDLADELGGGSHSSLSLHSSSGRRSQTDLGGASGYQRSMPNEKYSVSLKWVITNCPYLCGHGS